MEHIADIEILLSASLSSGAALQCLGFSFGQLLYVQIWIFVWNWGMWDILLLTFDEEKHRAGQALWMANTSAPPILLDLADWTTRQRLHLERLVRQRLGAEGDSGHHSSLGLVWRDGSDSFSSVPIFYFRFLETSQDCQVIHTTKCYRKLW